MASTRRRIAAWWRWMLQPWRSAGLITALVASFALPAFMAAGADVFRLSAADSVTRQALGEDPAGLDVSVFATGRLSADGVDALDAGIRRQLERIDRLGSPVRTVFVSSRDLGLQRPPAEEGGPAETIIGSGARFLARDGAVDALRVVEGDRSVDGIWISQRLSERLSLRAGALIAVNDSEPVPVAGVYADLWDGERDVYWDDVPPELVPTFSSVFNGPLFEVIVLPEDVLYRFAIDGVTRWDATVVDRPDSLAALQQHTGQVRRLQQSFTESDDVVSALSTFSGPGGPVPSVRTDAFDLRREVDGIVAELDQPIGTTAFGGTLLGLVVTAAGAAFAVRRRETEMRLLRADGDSGMRFAARALMQYLPPAVLGGIIGALAGWTLIAIPGETGRPGRDAIEVAPIVWTVAAGLLVAAAITGFSASRVLTTRSSALGALRLSWLLPVVGLAVASWIQVGSAADPGEVDPLVIAFPLIGLLAGVGVIVLAARLLMRRVHRTGRSLPPALFLAWRRVTSAESGAVLLSAAMGVALGLVVFSTTLADSLGAATTAKATTVVGGRTRAELNTPYEADLPAASTLVWLQTQRLTIGDRPVNVVVIDTASYVDGVSWDPAFGASAQEVVDALAAPVDADVAAVVAGGRAVPRDGGFGSSSVVSYEVVMSVAAAPLAAEVYPTLIVSADAMATAARRDHAAQRPPEVDPDDWAATFRSPLDRYRRMIVSHLDEPALRAFLEARGLEPREVVTIVGEEGRVGNRAVAWTFDFLGLLAVIAALAAAGTMMFYLSEEHARRQLSMVMARRMGLRRVSAAVAAVAEVLGLVVLALVAGTSTALLLAVRVFDRFEPDPRVPPDVGLDVQWAPLAVIAAAALTFVVGAALVNQWASARRSYGEVLRGG